MEDHTDDSRYVLTQGKNSSEDWIARGQNFMDSRLYDLAAHCYKVAQDPVRFTVATAYASVMLVKSKQAVLTQAQMRQEHFRVQSTCLPCPFLPSAALVAKNIVLFWHLHCFCPCCMLAMRKAWLQHGFCSCHHARYC